MRTFLTLVFSCVATAAFAQQKGAVSVSIPVALEVTAVPGGRMDAFEKRLSGLEQGQAEVLKELRSLTKDLRAISANVAKIDKKVDGLVAAGRTTSDAAQGKEPYVWVSSDCGEYAFIRWDGRLCCYYTGQWIPCCPPPHRDGSLYVIWGNRYERVAPAQKTYDALAGK